MLTINCRY